MMARKESCTTKPAGSNRLPAPSSPFTRGAQRAVLDRRPGLAAPLFSKGCVCALAQARPPELPTDTEGHDLILAPQWAGIRGDIMTDNIISWLS